jgi:hypothetical protein
MDGAIGYNLCPAIYFPTFSKTAKVEAALVDD